MRRRKLIASLLCGLIAAICWHGSAYAHVLESDGGVSAILHIPPDDEPRAAQPATVSLAFASDQAGFDLNNYRVEVQLLRNDAVVARSQLQAETGSRSDGSAVITFPGPGAYRLRISGQPLQGGQAFELRFSVRAAGAQGTNDSLGNAGSDFWIISSGSLIVLVIIARYRLKQGKRYHK